MRTNSEPHFTSAGLCPTVTPQCRRLGSGSMVAHPGASCGAEDGLTIARRTTDMRMAFGGQPCPAEELSPDRSKPTLPC